MFERRKQNRRMSNDIRLILYLFFLPMVLGFPDARASLAEVREDFAPAFLGGAFGGALGGGAL